MKFKIDENLPAEVAADLRAAGQEADTVADQGLAGAADPATLAHVQAEGRVLFTLDKGIADIRAYPPQDYAGIVLFAPRLRAEPRCWLSFVSICPPCCSAS